MMLALRTGVPITALLLLVVAVAARTDSPRIPPPITQPDSDVGFVECTMGRAPAAGPEIYAKLDKCMRNDRRPWKGVSNATAAQVRHWVEVDKAGAWLENGSWWLPLSADGVHYRWGPYAIVPVDGGDCRGWLFN
jgi:hypothetical protein